MKEGFTVPLVRRLARAARQLGGDARPCTYAVTVDATSVFVRLKLPDDQGPFVICAFEPAFSTAMALDLAADGRSLTTSPVSTLSVSGLAIYGLELPAPVFLSNSGSLSITRSGTLAAGSYAMAGFHPDPRTWAALRAQFGEFCGLGLGPIGVGAPPSKELYSDEMPYGMRIKRMTQDQVEPANVIVEIRIGGRQMPVIANSDSSIIASTYLNSGFVAVGPSIFVDCDIRTGERVMVRRVGTPITVNQPLSFIGWRL